ncbi:MAG TPA: hypothetical protein VJH97_02735 [Candidatus Nanoarchaeia archaeon]|nr:hypothetical protein [Candidatus Nanoarchaeia archaeon]
MRIVMFVISALLAAAGIMAFFEEALPSGTFYHIIVVGIGVLGLIATFVNVTMIGVSKVVSFFIYVAAIAAGGIPLVSLTILPTGIVYNLIITGIGALGILFSFFG